MKKIGQHIVKGIGYFFIFILCFECALYLAGYSTYEYQKYKVESQPDFPYLPNDSLGIVLRPGSYEITINDSLTFRANHLSNGLRRTGSTECKSNKEEVHFLGCSFTYGYGVGDLETFVALYQKNHLDQKVYNRSVIGYGTVQNYIQMKRILKSVSNKKRIFNLIFSSHHLHRNTLSNSYRKDLKIGFANSSKDGKDKFKNAKFPYVEQAYPLRLEYEDWDNMYSNLPGRTTFRVVNWVQNWTDYFSDVSDTEVDVAFVLLQEMVSMCKLNNAELNIVILDDSPKVLTLKNRLSNAGILYNSIEFDFNEKELTNFPYDSHPSAKGHQFIYDKMITDL